MNGYMTVPRTLHNLQPFFGFFMSCGEGKISRLHEDIVLPMTASRSGSELTDPLQNAPKV
jgi:hypothetical protein